MKPRFRFFHRTGILAAFLVACGSLRAVPITVSWGTESEQRHLASSDGTLLAQGSLVLLGTFDAATDFTGHAGDYNYLLGKFTSFAAAAIGDGGFTGVPGAFAASTVVTVPDVQLYYWAFNASTAEASTEWGIFTETTGLWNTPDTTIPDSTNTDLADANLAPVGSLTDLLAQTTPARSVPDELPWATNAALLGTALLCARLTRHRRHA